MICIGKKCVVDFLHHCGKAANLTLHGLDFLRVLEDTSKDFLEFVS
jgi:hypothetical protein